MSLLVLFYHTTFFIEPKYFTKTVSKRTKLSLPDEIRIALHKRHEPTFGSAYAFLFFNRDRSKIPLLLSIPLLWGSPSLSLRAEERGEAIHGGTTGCVQTLFACTGCRFAVGASGMPRPTVMGRTLAVGDGVLDVPRVGTTVGVKTRARDCRVGALLEMPHWDYSIVSESLLPFSAFRSKTRDSYKISRPSAVSRRGA